MEAKQQGAKLIVFDTRLSNTATHADYWVSPSPGSEAAILLASEDKRDEAAATWLAESALRHRSAEIIALALPVAAAVLVRDHPERAASLISTADETAGAHDTPY